MTDNDYLWDRSGPPDDDVVALEQALAPLAHRDGALPLDLPRAGIRQGSDRGQTGVRRGSDEGQTRVRPGSDEGQTGVRPGSDEGQTGV